MCVFLNGCAARFMFLTKSGLTLSCIYSPFLNMVTAVFLADDNVRFTLSTLKHCGVVSCIASFIRLKLISTTGEKQDSIVKIIFYKLGLLRTHFFLPFINSHWDVVRTESIRLNIISIKAFEILFILSFFSLVKIFGAIGRSRFGCRSVTSFSLACWSMSNY